MPQNQRKIEGNPVKCIGCGRQIAKGFITHGMIQIPCKCGVMNTIEAEHKPEGRQRSISVRFGELDINGDILMPEAFKKTACR